MGRRHPDRRRLVDGRRRELGRSRNGRGQVAGFGLPRLASAERRPALLVGTLALGAVSVQFLPSTVAAVLAPAIVVLFVSRIALVPLLVMPLMDHHDVGPERTVAATGLFFTTAQIGGVTGPALTGLLSELSGGFRLPLVVHSAIMAGLAVTVVLGYRRSLTETLAGNPLRRQPLPGRSSASSRTPEPGLVHSGSGAFHGMVPDTQCVIRSS